MLTPGFWLQNRYQVVRLIAKGGMGAVYEAFDQRLHSTIALKECLFNDDRLNYAFAQEAKLLASLRHPALPKVTDHFAEGNAQFLVMEYIAGPDLAEIQRQRSGPFPVDQVVAWADQLLSLLEYLHAQKPPIIHRDIKPQNMKLSAQGEIILLDFGLAKGSVSQTLSLTANSVVHGYSPQYSSIEQIRGLGTDERSDIYSLAATLYHLVTGRPPLDAVARAADLASGLPDQLVEARALNPEVPEAFSKLIHSMLALNRDYRPATTAFLRKKLRQQVLVGISDNAGYTTKSMGAGISPSADTFRDIQSSRSGDFSTRELPPMPHVSDSRVTSPAPPPIMVEPTVTVVTQNVRKSRAPILIIVLLAFGVLIVGGAIIGGGLYWLKAGVQGPAISTNTDNKNKINIPSPYLEALDSVAPVFTHNAATDANYQNSGFYVAENEIVVPTGVIAGASSGYVTLIGSAIRYDITDVPDMDRIHGLSILRVNNSSGKPLPFATARPAAVGDKVVILGSTDTGQRFYKETTITGYNKDKDLLEIPLEAGASVGSAIVDSTGQAVGILIGSPADNKSIQTVMPIGRLGDFLASEAKRKPQPLSLAGAGAKEILFDFSNSKVKTPKLGPAAEQKILTAVFHTYLKSSDQCGEYLGSLDEARNAGQITPEVMDSATGSFTAPGTQQTAYLINVGECGASHADGYGSKRLVVFEGQKIVANIDTDQRGQLLKTIDLDQDGIDELLLGAFGGNAGEWAQVAALADVKGGKLHILNDFGQTAHDTCAAMIKGRNVTTAVIFYSSSPKGQMPEFRMDIYRRGCNEKAFHYLSTGKFPE